MDRGRVGYSACGNKSAVKHLIQSSRERHVYRLNKIKHRKPGSSATMDNTPPHIIPALLNDPRKNALKQEFNVVVERENKALLKRIGRILTGPPEITDEDYQEMRKLCPSFKGPKELYEENLVKQNHKKFMARIKTIPGCYNAKSWEQDYRKQLFHQRFIRQVTYVRPKDFVDPFAPQDGSESSLLGGRGDRSSRSGGGHNSSRISASGGQVGRIKSLRKSVTGSPSHSEEELKLHHSVSHGSLDTAGVSSYNEEEYVQDGSVYEKFHEDKVELITMSKIINIEVENKNSRGINVYQSESDISCWYYYSSQSMVIIITSNIPDEITDIIENMSNNNSGGEGGDEPNFEYIQSEAEVALADLQTVRSNSTEIAEMIANSNKNNVMNNKRLEALAIELLSTVGLRIESIDDAKYEVRVQIEMVSNEASEESGFNVNKIETYDYRNPENVVINASDGDFSTNIVVENQMEVFKDLSVPFVIFYMEKWEDSIDGKIFLSKKENVDKMLAGFPPGVDRTPTRKSVSKEMLKCSVTLRTLANAQADIIVVVSESSRYPKASKGGGKNMQPNQMSIARSEIITTRIGIPSIALSDVDFLNEFVNNTISGVIIDHNRDTGTNCIRIDF